VQCSDMSRPLNRFSMNVYSENGEDGIILEILDMLRLDPDVPKWCCEFGAYDGKYASNTFNLVSNMGWHSVYIESDCIRFNELLKTSSLIRPKIIPINAQVSPDPCANNSLENILKRTPIPKKFDLLSVDIDSYDLDVWETFDFFEPKIVIIEINSSILPGILQRHSTKTQGNSFSSTLNVGIKKGYTLVCHTGNLIFVRNELVQALGIPQRFIDYPELLFLYDSKWMILNSPKRSWLRRLLHRFLPKTIVRLLGQQASPGL
jgi:hypothetical protein